MSELSREVLVDMDGVLTCFDDGVEAGLREQHPEIEIVRPRSHFYIHEDYSEEHHAAIQGIWQASGFYRGLSIREGTLEGWQIMESSGYPPRICSSFILQNPDCVQEKIDWLEEKMAPTLGPGVIDQAIFDRDKSRHDGLALIDDKPVIPGAEHATWTQIIFDAPYNRPSDVVSGCKNRIHRLDDDSLLYRLWMIFSARVDDC
jgi:5'(3')-deoxyribonucleotidase